MFRRGPTLPCSFLPKPRLRYRRTPSNSCFGQSIPHRPICSTSLNVNNLVWPHPHPTTRNLAPSTFKSIKSSLYNSSAASIASARTEAIARHLSTAASPTQTATMSYGKPSEYTARKIGAPNTLEYRCFVEKDGTPLSPFHDIPLFANEQQTVLNMIVEIPRWSNAKLEV
jgi:hypothetical protein